jgi:hypothetical protein
MHRLLSDGYNSWNLWLTRAAGHERSATVAGRDDDCGIVCCLGGFLEEDCNGSSGPEGGFVSCLGVVLGGAWARP